MICVVVRVEAKQLLVLVRLIDFVYHLTLGWRVIKKKQKS